MYCQECGRKVPDDAKFCFFCGTAIKAPAEDLQPAADEPLNASAAAESAAEEPAKDVAAEVLKISEEETAEAVPQEVVQSITEESITTADEAAETVAEDVKAIGAVADTGTAEMTEAAADAVENIIDDVTSMEEAVETADAISTEIPDAVVEDFAETESEMAPKAVELSVGSDPEQAPESAVVPPAFTVPPMAAAMEDAPRKKSKLPLVLIIALLVLADLIGYFVIYNSPGNKIKRGIAKAEALCAAEDHKSAADVYRSLLQIRPGDSDLASALSEEYISMADQALTSNDQENAIVYYRNALNSAVEADDTAVKDNVTDEILKKLMAYIDDLAGKGEYSEAVRTCNLFKDLLPGKSDTFEDRSDSVLYTWADEILSRADDDEVSAFFDELGDMEQDGIIREIPDDIYSDLLVFMQDVEDRRRFEEYAESIAAFLDPLFDGEDEVSRDKAFDSFTYDLDPEGSYADVVYWLLDQTDEMPVITALKGTDRKLGIYYHDDYNDGGYYLYYGDYDGDVRSGKGIWLFTEGDETDSSYTRYYALCDWVDDLPNGNSFEYSDILSYNSSEPTVRAVTTTVKGGLYEGSVEYDYREKGIKLYGQYTDGHPEVLDYETPNGDTAYVIAYSEDKNAWLTNMWGSIATSGIRGID